MTHKEALKRITRDDTEHGKEYYLASDVDALLAQPEQEPVAAQCKFDTEKTWGPCSVEHHNLVQSEPEKWPQYQTRLLYTTPPYVATPRQRKPLTREQVKTIMADDYKTATMQERADFMIGFRAAEAAHGIKE